MNIRLFFFLSAFIFSIPALSMGTYNLADALELAHNLGVRKDDLDVITHALLKLARKDEDPIIIRKDIVFETIADILQERIIIDTLPRVRTSQQLRHLESQPLANPFDDKFEKCLLDIASTKAIACEYEQQGDQEKTLDAIEKLSAMHAALEAECIKQSTNKWFLTGDLLFKKLKISEVQAVNAEKGLIIPALINTKGSFYQLVSHQQIYTSCGFNSLANACAIEQLVRDGLPITAEHIRALAEFCFLDTIHCSDVFRSLQFEDGIHLADGLHIEKASDDIKKKYLIPFHQIYLSANELVAFQDETTMQPIIDLIKANPVVHFIINGSGHWVLVSIVREKGAYVLYHLNSTNEPIHEGPLMPIISYLEELILLAKN